MSDGDTTTKLSSCGCCAGAPETASIYNRPGLTALSYRLGTYRSFLEQLFDSIGSATILGGPNQGAQPLATLTTRSLDDPSIALLDAWAIVADILTFYQERIANEGYLRTATERRSVLELARAIGYELSPGVAASAYLQFSVEEIIGAAAGMTASGTRAQAPAGPGSSLFNSGIVDVPQGAQVQSVPSPGQLPQTFETSADFVASAEWNSLSPRLVRQADLALSNGKLYLLGTNASFQSESFVWLQESDIYPLNTTLSQQAGGMFHFVPLISRVSDVAGLSTVKLDASSLSAATAKTAAVDTQASAGSSSLIAKSFVEAPRAFSSTSERSLATTTKFTAGSERNIATVGLFNQPQQVIFRPPLIMGGPKIQIIPQQGSGALIPAVEVTQLYLQGMSTNLKYGDRLLLVGIQGTKKQTQSFVVRDVAADSAMNRTLVTFAEDSVWPSFAPPSLPQELLQQGKIPFNEDSVQAHILEKSISESDLQAFLKMNGWDTDALTLQVNNLTSAMASGGGAFAFRATASFFGHNAPKWKSLPDPSKSQREDPYPLNWDAVNGGSGTSIWTDSQSNVYFDANVFLERSFPQVLPQSWLLLESPEFPTTAFTVSGVKEKSLADYGLSGKSTGLQLDSVPDVTGYDYLGGSLVNNPAVVSWGHDRLDVFVVGSADRALYHKWWDGNSWGPSTDGYEYMAGMMVGDPVVASWDHDRLDVFVVGTDGALYHKAWTGSQWLPSLTGYERLGIPKAGVTIRGNPKVVSWDHDRLDVFVVGTDGALYHKWWNGGWGPSVNDFEFMGGSINGDPAVASWDHDRLDVFVVGTDKALHHKAWDGNQWLPSLTTFDTLGGVIISNPAVASWGHDRLDVFVVGTDHQLYHKWWNIDAWGPSVSDYEAMGGFVVGDPAVTAWDHDRLDVLVMGGDRALYHKAWNGKEWLPSLTGYEDLGGVIISNIAAACWDHDRLDAFVIGTDQALYHKAWDGVSWGRYNYPVRKTTAFVQSEQLALAPLPIVDDIPAGTVEIMLSELVLGLKPGQPVALNGLRADASGVTVNEIAILSNIVHVGGFTVLQFQSGLQYSYLRSSLAINANVTLATHGATVSEILGNGDASQINQNFALKRPPLTYVSAPTPTGIASTLHIRVNDLEWTEAPALHGLTSSDEEYKVRLADDGTPTVTFGEPAARLKTGQQNVRATYRTGIGRQGNVAAGSLSMLLTRPPGLRGVTNPLPASGGADPQDLAHARQNAPLAVLTLERIVSLDDYENFAQSFAGIGKAQAIVVWSGENRLVHITVAAANGDPIDPTSPLYSTLGQAIELAHDPVQKVMVASYQPLIFDLNAGVTIDQPRYQPQAVLAQVASALATAFSFQSRAFAQAVTTAEIVTLIQSVPGVIATDLNQLYLSSDPNGPSQTEPPAFLPAAPARWENGAIQPAQLLLLNPLGATLTVNP